MSITTKIGKLVNCNDGLTPIMLLHSFVIWSFEIMSQTENISPLPQCLWPQNKARCDVPWVTSTHRVTWPLSYIHQHNVYCYQFWDCEDIQLGVSFHKLNRSSCKVTQTILAALPLLPQGLLPLNLAKFWLFIRRFNLLNHNPLNTWLHGTMWYIRNILSPLPQCLGLRDQLVGLHKIRSFFP